MVLLRKDDLQETQENPHLVSQGVHDDVVGNDAQRVNLFHEDVGRDHVELDVLQEAAQNLAELGAVS